MHRRIVLSLAALVIAYTANADTFYVSPNGNDSNPGTQASPWLTLAGARDNLRNGGHLDGFGDITVFFDGGTYVFDQTVVFGTNDDGTPSQTITYAAMPGETPVFSSLVAVTGWTVFSGSIMQADLPSGISHVRYLQDASEDWLERSATARFSTIEPAGGPDNGCVECNWDTPSTQADRTNIQYPVSFSAPNWASASQYDLRQSTLPWHQEILPIQSVDVPNRRISTAIAGCFDMRADVQERPPQAWVLNSTAGIDQAGEWASLDGKIILEPLSGTGDIFVPKLTELVRIDDGTVDGNANIATPVQYIAFRGITFTGGDFRVMAADDVTGQHDWNVVDEPDSLLRIRNAANITVADCTFTKSGGGGIRADRYAQNILIDRNDFSFLGKSGIAFVGRGSGHGDVNSNNLIRQNSLERTGMEKWASPAIVLDQSSNNLVQNNLIRNTYYTGIALTAMRQLAMLSHVAGNQATYLGREFHYFEVTNSVVAAATVDGDDAMENAYNHDNIVSNNALIDVSEGQDMFLNGKIYVSGTKKNRSNFIRHNYIHDTFNHSANDYAWYSDSDQDACEYTGNMISGVLNDDNQPEATPLIVAFNIWAETETVGNGTILLRANTTLNSTFSMHILGAGNLTQEGNVIDGVGSVAAQVSNYQQSYRAICPGIIAGADLAGASAMQTSLGTVIGGHSGAVPGCPPQVSELETNPGTLEGLTQSEPIVVPITQFEVTFNQGMTDPAGNSAPDDVTNPANYLLVESGADGIVQTLSCGLGTAGDDVATSISTAAYNSGDQKATLSIAGGALAAGVYRLFICGTLENTNSEQLDGNGGGSGGDDFVRSFTVRDSDADGTLDGVDPSCSAINLVAQNATYVSGDTIVCSGVNTLRTAGTFTVNDGADVTLRSPQVTLTNGTTIANDGRLTVGL